MVQARLRGPLGCQGGGCQEGLRVPAAPATSPAAYEFLLSHTDWILSLLVGFIEGLICVAAVVVTTVAVCVATVVLFAV